MRKFISNFAIASLLLLGACVQPFEFDSNTYEKILVVEGSITNEPGPYFVRLSYTSPLDSSFSDELVDDATVYVDTDSGESAVFTSTGQGTYSSNSSFQGVIGERYTLTISFPDGKIYQSHVEELSEPVEISDIYGRFAEIITTDNDAKTGIQFFVDSQSAEGRPQYFRYEYDETYEIRTAFPAGIEVVNGQAVPREDPIDVCYQDQQSNVLLIGTSINSTTNKLTELPIRFVGTDDLELRSRYSMLLKQYSLSQGAYLYYRKLKENNESSGSLFDKQTGTLIGNIESLENVSEPVLGYFEVSGVTQLRQSFDRNQFGDEFSPERSVYQCSIENALVLELSEAIPYVDSVPTYNISYIIYGNPAQADSAYLFRKTCTTCDWFASTEVPEFWIE